MFAAVDVFTREVAARIATGIIAARIIADPAAASTGSYQGAYVQTADGSQFRGQFRCIQP
jgi:hypothetical protein